MIGLLRLDERSGGWQDTWPAERMDDGPQRFCHGGLAMESGSQDIRASVEEMSCMPSSDMD
eukprot:687145-Karenia_brevis.AAC.1